jgi:hypothetical protein
MTQTEFRPTGLILEELSDLTRYMESVPPHVKSSGVLAGYEARLRELQNELIASYIDKLIGSQLDVKPDKEFQSLRDAESASAAARSIANLERKYRLSARKNRNLQGALNYTAMLTAGFGAAASLLGFFRLAVPIASLITFAAILLEMVLRVPTKALENQRQLDAIMFLKDHLLRASKVKDQVSAARALLDLPFSWTENWASQPPHQGNHIRAG